MAESRRATRIPLTRSPESTQPRRPPPRRGGAVGDARAGPVRGRGQASQGARRAFEFRRRRPPGRPSAAPRRPAAPAEAGGSSFRRRPLSQDDSRPALASESAPALPGRPEESLRSSELPGSSRKRCLLASGDTCRSSGLPRRFPIFCPQRPFRGSSEGLPRACGPLGGLGPDTRPVRVHCGTQ